MQRISLAAAALILGVSGCASGPQTHATASLDPYDHYNFDRMSRIEITENLIISSATLKLNPTLTTISENDRVNAHERASAIRELGSERIRNKALAGGGQSFYVQAQNTFQQDGWSIDGDRLRHVESGLLCPSSIKVGEDGRPFALERVVEFNDKGRDIACHYSAQDNGDGIIAYASYWPEISLDEHTAAAVDGILQNYQVTQAVELPIVMLKSEEDAGDLADLINGMEETLAGGFEIGEKNGIPYRTSLWLVKTHGWHVKLRATYPSADEPTELLSAIHFMASHLAVRAKNMAEPIVPGVEI